MERRAERQDILPVYTDSESARSYRPFLRRGAVILVALALLGPAISTIMLANNEAERLEDFLEEREQATLAISSLIALSPQDSHALLLDAAGLAGVRVNLRGQITPIVTDQASDLSPALLDSWHESVAARSQRSAERTFRHEHPSGEIWIHHRVTSENGQVLITGTPEPSLTNSNTQLLWAIWIAAGVAIAGVAGALWFLDQRLVRPTRTIVSAVEDLQVRGKIRHELQSELEAISRGPIELNQLGSLLSDLSSDSQKTSQEAQALLDSAITLGGSLDESVVMHGALERVQSLLDVDQAVILRYRRNGDTAEVLAARGPSQEWLEEAERAESDSSKPWLQAIRNGEPAYVIDTEAGFLGEDSREQARRHGYRSLLAVPFAADLERPTVMVLQSQNPRSYSFDEIQLCRSFASIASAAIRNAELFNQTDVQLREQTSRLVSIVESVEHGILVEDGESRLLYVNPTLRRLVPELSEPNTIREFLCAVFDKYQIQPERLDDLEALDADSPGWLDFELHHPTRDSVAVYRVRKFIVRDARGNEMGRGQTWADITHDRELEQMKSGLLAAVSHEFRTPLALIKGYVTTLLAEDVEWQQSDQLEFLKLVGSEADRLTVLVKRILDMRRIDAGMVNLEKMPVRFDAVLNATLEATREHADRIVIHEHDSPIVEIDVARISTALRNLIENACKYSPADQQVEVQVESTDTELRVTVRDYGPGIDPLMSDRLFETFVRGSAGISTNERGVGLGLAISKGFVAAHGGSIILEQPDEGPGSVFGFVLPRSFTSAELDQ